MRARSRSPLSALALLLAVLAAGTAPALAQDGGSGGGGQGGSSGGSGGGGGGAGSDGGGQGGQDAGDDDDTGGDRGTGASGSSGTTGDLGTNRGRRSTSDVEDPGGGTSAVLPGADAGPAGAGPMVALPRERVRRMQERLEAAGFDPGPADGVMGGRTRAALRSFQEARGLDPNGEPNQATLTELGVE